MQLLRACVLFTLLLLIAYHASVAGPESGLAQAQATATPPTPTARLTTTLTITGTVRAPFVVFATPPPVRDEEPLTGASRDVPPVFPGVTDYYPVQAALASEDHAPPPVTSPAAAAVGVVQIRRCDSFGCDTPAGSGVLIHPSGLILTAYHVLLTDPEDPTSPRYTDFVIALSEDLRSAPQARYRARLAAEKNEQDLALLAIDRDAAGAVVDANQLNLPALPLADITTLFADDLHVLGYPVSGGEGVTYARTSLRSFDDGGRLIVVDPAPDPGASGGPALVQQEGRLAIAGLVIRRRSTQGQLSRQGLLRAIDQLSGLTWTPRAPRAWGEDVEAGVQISRTTAMLQLMLRLHTLDMVGRPLRLLFYATDAASGQPWQPANVDAPLVFWADVTPQQVVERRSLTLTAPLESLGAAPDRLRFYALLWDMEEERALWDDAAGVEVAPAAVAIASGAAAVSTPTPTGALIATQEPASGPTEPPLPTVQPMDTPAPATATAMAALVIPTMEAIAPALLPLVEHFGLPFVYVPAGTFIMGSPADVGYDNEHPEHPVTLDAFWISQTEITNAQFRPFLEAGGYANRELWTESGWAWRTENTITEPRSWNSAKWNQDNLPVVGVNWFEASAYATWLAQETNVTVRLPTEAEWERAACGTDGRTYPWGEAAPHAKLLNYNGNIGRTTAVGSYPDGVSPVGALDMAGNVLEWVADWFDPEYYSQSPAENPLGPVTSEYRTTRGGSWYFDGSFARCAQRFRGNPDGRNGSIGFRVASPGY
jgi:formylglycine-generating enzyme required for sulfatase activity